MDVTIQLELCLHEHTQIVANAACSNQQFHSYIDSYVIPYFLNFYSSVIMNLCGYFEWEAKESRCEVKYTWKIAKVSYW